ncbi:DUF4160 domain-containing protein [Rhizobium sp. SG570]|uniref:DUF4160 domain-containing protein n=1 Tax=Rhizobium sp. SG570 TaxID=2587113 RepID=UPI00119A36F1|nr:DUF4160 domain-containing protein [Rhizobium sp. SG570]NKJ40171.1 2-phospho-L-lactate guanylyltransferase (CobY/MobA/RfbA family) [Rhizobium sp. SG570]
MPTIARIGNVLIRVFANDHNPPHFHVVTPDHQALVSIDDFEVIQGSIDRGSLNTAIAWAKAHKEELNNEWNRLNER